MLVESAIVIVVLVCLLKWRKDNKPSGNIPGYMGIPLFGVIPWMSLENPALTFTSWKNKLGDIYSIKIGQKRWITLNSYKAIKKIFVKNGKNSSGRADLRIFTNGVGDEGMMFEADNKVKKKYLHSLTRNYMDTLESNIAEECKFLEEELKSLDGRTVNLKNLLMKTTCNVILRLTVGRRKDYKDSWMKKHTDAVLKLLNNTEDIIYITALMLSYQLSKLPVFSRVAKDCDKQQQIVYDLYDDLLNERRKVFPSTGQPNKAAVCLIDDFIITQRKGEGFEDHILRLLLSDIFTAGTDTTAVGVYWCILYLARNQAVQEKLHHELNRNSISYDGRINTPLTCSFIDEILRHRCITAIGGLHRVTETFEDDGKVFRKDDLILPNIWAANRDPEHFDEPEEFKADRFVIDGKYVKSKHVISFGMGPRMCFGKKIAEMELYLLISNILKNFKLQEDPQHPLPPFDRGLLGIIFNPLPFKVKITKR